MLRAVALVLLVTAVPAQASSSRAIGHPAWSPDGKEIAWTESSNTGGKIFVASSDVSDARPISKTAGALGEIQWLSRDEIMYVANYRLFRLALAPRRTRMFGQGLSFSTDATGTVVAWQTADTCPLCHGPIEVATVGRGQLVRLGGRDVQNAGPTLSPNGREVAFTRTFWNQQAGEYSRVGGIWTSSTRRNSLRKISPRGSCPSWAQDGRHIAYIDGTTLRLMTPNGSGSRRLADGVACDSSNPPEWAPDARSIAFTNEDGRLLVLDVSNDSKIVVTTSAVGTVTGFAWSPNSRRLLVTGIARARHGHACSQLWLVRPNGSEQTRKRSCS